MVADISIEEKQRELVDAFALLGDWTEKYEHIIALGKSLNELEEIHKTDVNLIKGCQSKVWLDAYLKEDKVIFTADSDAIITKGIIAVLIRVFSGHRPEEIAAANTNFIDEIGLKEHLSPTRANGLVSMIKQMKLYAVAFQAQLKK